MSAVKDAALQVAVCDDDERCLYDISKQLGCIDTVGQISAFSSYEALLFAIEEGKRYDAILMDIEWNRKSNGMDIAEKLFELSPHSKVIFVTGHPDRFMQHIFLHSANLSGFLSKPVDLELLKANLQKVADAMSNAEPSVLLLRRQGAPVPVPVRDILFIESKGHMVEVHTDGDLISAYERLGSIMSVLPHGFYQCHKSYIVNMSYIRRFEPTDILLKNGDAVPISRARYSKTKEAYFAYVGQSF